MTDIHIDKKGWKKCRFAEVAIHTKEIVDIDNTDLTRYVAGEHMDSEDIHIRKWGTVGDGYLGPAFIRRFHKGDILYGSRRTYLKKVAITEFDGITANTTFVIKAKEELIEPVLLVHLMLSKSFTEYSVTNSRGSVNPYVNWKDIADYEFLLPPKPEQKRLAALLWAADEMIEKEKRELEKMEKLMDIDIAEALGNCKDGQYEYSDRQLIEINKVIIKEKFEVGKLDTEQYHLHGKYPIIDQSKTPIAGYSDYDEIVFNGNLPVLVFGDHTTIVKYIDFPFILGADGTKIIQANENKVLSKYLFYAIKNLHIVPQGYRRHFSVLKEHKIPLLPKEIQAELVTRWDKLEKLTSKDRQQIEVSQQTKQELINKVF